MDLDYQQKYLKYKKKYLDLKYKEYSGGFFSFKVSKNYALKQVKINGRILEKMPYFNDDRDVVLAAIVSNPVALSYINIRSYSKKCRCVKRCI